MKIYRVPVLWDPVDEAVRAESLGFDGVCAVDHFFVPNTLGTEYLLPHSLVTLGAVAAATQVVGITQTVMNIGFHHPAELTQAILTLQRISNGRAELGLGAGWYEPEHEAFGYEFLAPRDRVDKLTEAAVICRKMLESNGGIDFEGKYYRVASDVRWPEVPTIPDIVIGGSGPRLLALAGAVANRVDLLHTIRAGRPVLGGAYCNNDERVSAMIETALRSAEQAENTVKFSATVFVSLSNDVTEIGERRRALASFSQSSPSSLAEDLLYVVGTQEDFLRVMTRLAQLGVDRVHLSALPPERQETLDLAVELLPQAKAI
ncbi:LLM class F420-dependent oxidoreductase [Pseudonocardia yunnanensis]|uniref:LLM class flavin-dependent oxidoreductase n=1 Tax=Pseudonocardia yunnanensis TaxID=58107 RepID=A0ABW4FB36_9PSEU